jgi:hypothetical protein
MDPEDLGFEPEPEPSDQDPPSPPLPDDPASLKAELEKERREKKQIWSQLKTFKAKEKDRLKTEFPFLTDEDFKGVSTAQLEKILRRATPGSGQSGQAGQSESQGQEGSNTEPSSPPASETVAAGRSFAANTVPSSGVAATGAQLTATEAHQKYISGEWSHARYTQAIASGEVKLRRPPPQ